MARATTKAKGAKTGRVKRSDGYNVDGFVATNSDVELLSDDDEEEHHDSESDIEVMDMKNMAAYPNKDEKPTQKPFIQRIDPRILSTSDLIALDHANHLEIAAEKKAAKKKRARTAALKLKTTFADAAGDDEVDEIIGSETESEYDESDVSSFKDKDSGIDSDFEDTTVQKSKKIVKKLKSTVVKAEASPPNNNLKRARDSDDDDDAAGRHIEAHFGHDTSSVELAPGFAGSYRSLSQAFDVYPRRGDGGSKCRRLTYD